MTTPSKADVLAPGVGRTISANLGVSSRVALGCMKVQPIAFHERPGVQLNTTIGRASRLVILQDPNETTYTVIAYRGREVLGSRIGVTDLHASITALTGVPLESACPVA